MAEMRGWVRCAVTLFLFGGLTWGMVSAQTEEKKRSEPLKLPMVFGKESPENIEELRDIEKHVQLVLKKIIPAVVGVKVGNGQGSGVLVSEDGLILTAGHVSGKPGQPAAINLPDGKSYKAKTLGRNTGIDSGMIKIADEGKFPYLETGKSSELKRGQWVIAIGHPGGFRAHRTPVVRVGRILFVSPSVIRTDCALVGGDSGGPLFDMQGRVIGIHSRIGGGSVTENIHVPIDTYRQTWTRLAKGESWGGPLGTEEVVKSAGGKIVFEKSEALTKDDPFDKVANRGGEPKECHTKIYVVPMKAGATYTIDMIKRVKSAKDLDPYLRLEAPDGKQLADDDDGAGEQNARIVFKAMEDGNYRVIASSFDEHQVGPFTLIVREASPKGAFVTGKVEVLRAIKLPGPVVDLVLEQFKDKKAPLHVNAVLVDESGALVPNASITFAWAKGAETLKSNGDGVVRWPLLKEKSRQLRLDLPKGVRAILSLTDPNGIEIGSRIGDRDFTFEKTTSAGGAIVKEVNGTLSPKDAIDTERRPENGKDCFAQIHTFKMQPGKIYTIELVSEDFDAFLRLEDAAKQKLAEDDDGAGFMNARIVFTPTTASVYRIVATSFDGHETGAYRLTIRETDAKTASKK